MQRSLRQITAHTSTKLAKSKSASTSSSRSSDLDRFSSSSQDSKPTLVLPPPVRQRKHLLSFEVASSSPTPSIEPSAKRLCKSVIRAGGIYTPKLPVPRRRSHFAAAHGPRTPSSSPFERTNRSRLHNHTPARSPGSTWSPQTGGYMPPSSPPTILVSPPTMDIEAVIAKSSRSNSLLHKPYIPHEWQFAFVGTLLARDQVALHKLKWQLDLAFATLACQPIDDDMLTLHPHLAARLAQQAARQTVSVLLRAWQPSSAAEFMYSPPSFRLSSITREATSGTKKSAAQALWAHHLSAMLGAEITQKIAAHIVQTLWYMATSDRRRAFARPLLLAKYCAGLVEHLRRWEAQETGPESRKLIFAPSDKSSAPAHSIPTSEAIRQSIHTALVQEFRNAQHSRERSRHETVKLKVPNTRPGTLPSKTSEHQDRKLLGRTTVDAARFLGELFREHTFIDRTIVASWLKSLLVEPKSWVDVPFSDLEAGCALLLLIGPHWNTETRLRGVIKERGTCNRSGQVQNRSDKEPDIVGLSLEKLQELVESHVLPDLTRGWITVSKR